MDEARELGAGDGFVAGGDVLRRVVERPRLRERGVLGIVC